MLATANQRVPTSINEDTQPFERTVFFTDRALYRPGQTIQYKGICVAVDQQSDNYQTLADKTVTVVFEDANGQEIAQQEHRTNRRRFVQRQLHRAARSADRADDDSRSQRDDSVTWFNVEEYKRPKFKVELAAPTRTPPSWTPR